MTGTPNLALIHTSVDDCNVSMSNIAETNPIQALEMGTNLFHYMNRAGIAHASRRRVIGKAMRKAIQQLEQVSIPQT